MRSRNFRAVRFVCRATYSHVRESTSEGNNDALSAATERGGGAVEGSVTGTEHDNTAVQAWQLIGLSTAAAATAETGLG